jgi:hypothetical protein
MNQRWCVRAEGIAMRRCAMPSNGQPAVATSKRVDDRATASVPASTAEMNAFESVAWLSMAVWGALSPKVCRRETPVAKV